MAIKNLALNIRRPGADSLGDKITFTSVATANDYLRIPRRYPFADIANYSTLVTDGFFRHGLKYTSVGIAGTTVKTVSTELGGSVTTNTEGVLGYELPNTEKLVLLVKKGATTDETFVIEGSLEYGIPDVTIATGAGAVGDLFEVDLYNFGLFIGGIDGEHGVMIKAGHTTLAFALIARAA